MGLVRILIDGYSLLHNWPELAPGHARHSERARDELTHILTKYHDATGEVLTIFFDGSGPVRSGPKAASNRNVEILFSRGGQTADDMIERAAHRFQEYGEVLVVTNDFAERDTVSGMGAQVASCENFIRMVESALTDLQDDLRNYNRTEQNRFKRQK